MCQPVEETAVVEEPASEGLKSLEDEIESDDLDSVLSLVELKNLDSMLSEMPPPDPVVDEVNPEEEPAPLEDLDLSNWLPLAEENIPAAAAEPVEENIPTEESTTVETVGEAETEGEVIPPPLPPEFLDQFQSEEEKPVETPVTSPGGTEIPDLLFDLPWEADQNQAEPASQPGDEIPQETIPSIESVIGDVEPTSGDKIVGNEDDAFNAWLDELKEPAPESGQSEIPSEQKPEEDFPPLPEEWFSQPVSNEFLTPADSQIQEEEPVT